MLLIATWTVLNTQPVLTNVTMLTNGTMKPDLTNVMTNVTVMVKEPVTVDGALVMLDLMITPVPTSLKMLPMLSMTIMMIVTLLLSTLNVTTWVKS